MYLCIDNDIPILSLENTTGMLRFFFCKHTVLNFISDDFYLRLEAILRLHAHHERDTLSNGNIVRKRMNHFSHNADNIKLCNRGRDDDTGVYFQYGFRLKFHSSQFTVVKYH